MYNKVVDSCYGSMLLHFEFKLALICTMLYEPKNLVSQSQAHMSNEKWEMQWEMRENSVLN